MAPVTPDLVTPSLAERLKKLLGEATADATPDVQAFVRAAAAAGIGLVDTARHRSWIDETVYTGALWRLSYWRDLADRRAPVPMILFCPRCGSRHIDRPEPETGWMNPPHRSHLCEPCGHIWRPADIATVGVDSLDTRGRLDREEPSRAGQHLPFAEDEAA